MDASPGGVWTGHLTGPEVRGALGGSRIVHDVHGVAVVGSTQDLALELARDGSPSGTVVVADRQTAGRGRAGRRWDDRADGGTLALSVLLDADVVDVASLVPHALGVAIVEACRVAVPAAPPLGLKWPNDVVHRRSVSGPARKLSGVLVERAQLRAASGVRDVLVCGIGIDVDLRGGTAADRVCLAELSGDVPGRGRLLGGLIGAIDGALSLLADAPSVLLERYRSCSDTIGRTVEVRPLAAAGPGSVSSEPVRGVATDIDDEGRLLVTTDGTTHAILSGSVRDAAADTGPHGGAP